MLSDFGSHMLKMVKPQDKVAQVPTSLLGVCNLINQDICFRLYISKTTSLSGLNQYTFGG